MVSLKIQFLTTILLVSEGYGQLVGCGCYPQPRCGPTTISAGCSPAAAVSQPRAPTPSIIPAGQFIIPAIIKPLISSSSCSGLAPAPSACMPSRPPPSVPCSSAPCADNDDDSELDRLLYLLISQIIENKKCSGKRSGYSPSIVCDDSSDYGTVGSYGDDYEYGQCQPTAYCPSGLPSSCDNSCPDFNLCIRPFAVPDCSC